jgi:hypothetical protein
MNKPVFLITLDTELLWGPAGGKDGKELFDFIKRNGKNSRNVISTLLDLFQKYKIPATWAVVGHLFLDHCNEETCLTKKNMNEFGYKHWWYNDPYSNIEKDPLYYGKDIIERILVNPINHELGYHSFSHTVFTIINRKMAEAEIKESKKIEKEWNIKFSSFVFPLNEIAYVDVLKENGFKIYRGNTVGLFDDRQNMIFKKIRGTIKKFIAPPIQPKWMDGIWEVQSSMFFSDIQIPPSLLLRGKIGLERAIKDKKIFHIWLHPWDLFVYNRLRDDLEKMLKYVNRRRAEGKLEIMTMAELAKYLNSDRTV